MKFIYQVYVNDHFVAQYSSMKKAKEIFNICCNVTNIFVDNPIAPVVIRVVPAEDLNSDFDF